MILLFDIKKSANKFDYKISLSLIDVELLIESFERYKTILMITQKYLYFYTKIFYINELSNHNYD